MGRRPSPCLDAEPLPDEPFDWSVVPADLGDEVAATLSAIDRVCDAALDVELRTVSRRLLARLVEADTAPFRRSPHHDRLAAGIVAVACFDERRVLSPGADLACALRTRAPPIDTSEGPGRGHGRAGLRR